jgi:hypothetical protein
MYVLVKIMFTFFKNFFNLHRNFCYSESGLICRAYRKYVKLEPISVWTPAGVALSTPSLS